MKNKYILKMTRISILSAMAIILMFLEFPLPFTPPFYELDFSEVPVLIGAFAMGPVSGIIIEFIKIVGNICFTGTQTAFVGELANFIMGLSYILPAAIIYKYIKTKKGAIFGLIIGSFSLVLIGALVNAFVMLPAYSFFMEIPIDVLINMGTKINPLITNLPLFIILAVVPFNLIKGILVSLIVILIYKYISPLLHDKNELEEIE